MYPTFLFVYWLPKEKLTKNWLFGYKPLSPKEKNLKTTANLNIWQWQWHQKWQKLWLVMNFWRNHCLGRFVSHPSNCNYYFRCFGVLFEVLEPKLFYFFKLQMGNEMSSSAMESILFKFYKAFFVAIVYCLIFRRCCAYLDLNQGR